MIKALSLNFHQNGNRNTATVLNNAIKCVSLLRHTCIKNHSIRGAEPTNEGDAKSNLKLSQNSPIMYNCTVIDLPKACHKSKQGLLGMLILFVDNDKTKCIKLQILISPSSNAVFAIYAHLQYHSIPDITSGTQFWTTCFKRRLKTECLASLRRRKKVLQWFTLY